MSHGGQDRSADGFGGHIAVSDDHGEQREAMAIIYDELKPYRGSISAEHGIGLEKRAFLGVTRNDSEVALMRALKQALDAHGFDAAFGGADAFATAYTLAMGVRKNGDADVVLCGMASSDGATEWVGPEMAVMLDMPVATMVREIIAHDNAAWEVKAALENGFRRVKVRLPAVFTVTRDLNTPRTLSFSGI